MYTSNNQQLDLITHNREADYCISKSLNCDKGHINKSAFDWFLAIQVTSYELNNAETSDTVSNDNLYSSIRLESAPKSNLYSQPSDYEHYTKNYAQIAHSQHSSVRLNFFNALCPLSLHWQSECQLIADEVLNNLPLHKQIALKNTLPPSINKIKNEMSIEQSSYFQSNSQINNLADSLLDQIQQVNS